ncbi:hypothetical protein LTR94_016403 [Friedmanniomyces endolithicus]|nr:hypothetical protein LTR94_016403 [Friedmanniomyces endolithicus]
MTAKAKPVSPEDALDPKKALVPTVVKVNEARVTRGFWPKIQRTAARIPFADQALAAWLHRRRRRHRRPDRHPGRQHQAPPPRPGGRGGGAAEGRMTDLPPLQVSGRGAKRHA